MKIIPNENGIYDSVSSVLDVLSEDEKVEISAENRSVQKLIRFTTEKENLFKSSLKFKIKELKVFSKKPYFSVRKERKIDRNCCHLWKSLM